MKEFRPPKPPRDPDAPKRKYKQRSPDAPPDKRKANGGARPGAGRPPTVAPANRKNTTVAIAPRYKDLARKRHGSLAKALMFAAFNGGKTD